MVGKPTEPVAPAHVSWLVPMETVDEVSKQTAILKMFVQRPDKAVGLFSWIKDTAAEAIKHGDVSHLPDGHSLAVRYAGLRIEIDVEGNLRHVKSIELTPV